MFYHCIFCSHSLGNNEVIEQFPVGKRLAFDSAKGRLWVVCARCNRWNLSPLEERWEAIDTCEGLFRDTPTRLSTENIGLARLSEGLQLVRIGKPQRPEFAAWRYGTALRSRMYKAHTVSIAFAVASAGTMAINPLSVAIGLVAVPLVYTPQLIQAYSDWIRIVVRLRDDDGNRYKLRLKHVQGITLRTDADGWAFLVPHTKGRLVFRDEYALRAAALALPHYNRWGAGEKDVQATVKEIGAAPSALEFFAYAAREMTPRYENEVTNRRKGGYLMLGLEMVAHEEQERRALEGELHELEAMWREADEVAKIADKLLLPPAIADRFRKDPD